MSATLGVPGLVDDEAILVYCYLSFDGVLFLFAAVMRLSLAIGFWGLKFNFFRVLPDVLELYIGNFFLGCFLPR